MPEDFFPYWTEKTADAKTPPTMDKLIEMLQQYRLCIQGRTINSSSTRNPSVAYATKQRQNKSTTLHVQKDNNTCSLCHEGNHPLYLCSTFKAKSVEVRFSTATRLKVCTNCLLASERSERDTIRGNKWKSEIYIYTYIYMVRARHFSSVGLVLRNVGGVKCEQFLKHSNYW